MQSLHAIIDPIITIMGRAECLCQICSLHNKQTPELSNHTASAHDGGSIIHNLYLNYCSTIRGFLNPLTMLSLPIEEY